MAAVIRILLIDDDKVDRTMVRRALEKSGLEHDLVEAPDAAIGLRCAKEQTFDCVLLDYRLPDADAFELLTVLLSPEGGGQAVLMLTGEADQEIAIRLMRAGALDYLTKAEVTPSSSRSSNPLRESATGVLGRDQNGTSRGGAKISRPRYIKSANDFSVFDHSSRSPQSLPGAEKLFDHFTPSCIYEKYYANRALLPRPWRGSRPSPCIDGKSVRVGDATARYDDDLVG